MKKGFVTLAAGDEKYYKLAANLLLSYRRNTKNIEPFGILADRKNKYTDLFDKVYIIDKPYLSYMDKIKMLNTPLFEKTIFIDADCLIYDDIHSWWNCFPSEGVACFGKSLDTTSKDGWFEIDDIGEYKNKINFIPQMHGGAIFFNNDETTKSIYKESVEIIKDYSKYNFKYFSEPADEPILALAMAINKCHPIELPQEIASQQIVFYPAVKNIKVDITKRQLSFCNIHKEWIAGGKVLHWQNCNTDQGLYHGEVLKLKINSTNYISNIIVLSYVKYIDVLYILSRWNKRILNKIKKLRRNKGRKVKS